MTLEPGREAQPAQLRRLAAQQQRSIEQHVVARASRLVSLTVVAWRAEGGNVARKCVHLFGERDDERLACVLALGQQRIHLLADVNARDGRRRLGALRREARDAGRVRPPVCVDAWRCQHACHEHVHGGVGGRAHEQMWLCGDEQRHERLELPALGALDAAAAEVVVLVRVVVLAERFLVFTVERGGATAIIASQHEQQRLALSLAREDMKRVEHAP